MTDTALGWALAFTAGYALGTGMNMLKAAAVVIATAAVITAGKLAWRFLSNRPTDHQGDDDA